MWKRSWTISKSNTMATDTFSSVSTDALLDSLRSVCAASLALQQERFLEQHTHLLLSSSLYEYPPVWKNGRSMRQLLALVPRERSGVLSPEEAVLFPHTILRLELTGFSDSL